MRRWIKRGLIVLAALVVSLVGFVVYIHAAYPAHQHCIKIAGVGFRMYEGDHQGRLPFDTNGFGDALMVLIKSGSLDEPTNAWRFVTGVGDNGKIFREALVSGAHIPEASCTRVYAQGLSETNDPEIAVLFDRFATPGGDHFHFPGRKLVREVCFLDSHMEAISDAEWTDFSSNQVELLVKNGIPRPTARHYYDLTKR